MPEKTKATGVQFRIVCISRAETTGPTLDLKVPEALLKNFINGRTLAEKLSGESPNPCQEDVQAAYAKAASSQLSIDRSFCFELGFLADGCALSLERTLEKQIFAALPSLDRHRSYQNVLTALAGCFR